MQCPYCGSSDRLDVKDTRRDEAGSVTRRRKCASCGQDFRTVETLADGNVRVRKANGSVVPFDHTNVSKSIRKAAVRRVRERDRLNALAEQVRDTCVSAAVDGVISSMEVSDHVLEELAKFDKVSHVRYALTQVGRMDRRDSGRPGWQHADQVRKWLAEQYPDLRGFRPSPDLSEVVKRDKRREKFDAGKLERSIGYASKGRKSDDDAVYEFAKQVADAVERQLQDQPLVTSGQLAAEALGALRKRDHVAFLRYASSIKGYRSVEDYETEAVALRNF